VVVNVSRAARGHRVAAPAMWVRRDPVALVVHRVTRATSAGL
jgi:hypothetical protein